MPCNGACVFIKPSFLHAFMACFVLEETGLDADVALTLRAPSTSQAALNTMG